jgi:leucine-rich repeat/coiled-coil domain-containing protein 1
MRLQL